MTHDGMPRAYLRIDPNLDQTHPDPGAFVRLLCAAARQPERGRFKDRALVERAVGRARAKAMIARGDLSPLADGRLYVEGWDEWQEGDYTVSERMRRMRHRRAAKRNGVTPPALPDCNDVTTVACREESLVGSRSTGDGDGVDSPPPPTSGGRRKDGTNPRTEGTAPRSIGANPRANGESPRQVREAQKRGPTKLVDIFAQLADQDGTA